MKLLIPAILTLLFFLGCQKQKKRIGSDTKNITVLSKDMDRTDSLPLRGAAILYDVNESPKDTIYFKNVSVLRLEAINDYPSSQKDKTICKTWELNENSIKTILRYIKPISNIRLDAQFSTLACNYKSTIEINGENYNLNINGGAWVEVTNSKLEGRIGCFNKKCLQYFLSEPWTPPNEDY